ncbi:MAG: hypothetical protein GX892_04840 [Thermoanaerobacteraceae bacterium]|jgi:hypothetical protein|nr:hypothetical protein [Thermoanaerobacteraceae bacterium]
MKKKEIVDLAHTPLIFGGKVGATWVDFMARLKYVRHTLSPCASTERKRSLWVRIRSDGKLGVE